MTFETSQRLDKWVEKHRKECKTRATAGEQFVWSFYQVALLKCQTVKDMCCGSEFTDYVD